MHACVQTPLSPHVNVFQAKWLLGLARCVELRDDTLGFVTLVLCVYVCVCVCVLLSHTHSLVRAMQAHKWCDGVSVQRDLALQPAIMLCIIGHSDNFECSV